MPILAHNAPVDVERAHGDLDPSGPSSLATHRAHCRPLVTAVPRGPRRARGRVLVPSVAQPPLVAIVCQWRYFAGRLDRTPPGAVLMCQHKIRALRDSSQEVEVSIGDAPSPSPSPLVHILLHQRTSAVQFSNGLGMSPQTTNRSLRPHYIGRYNLPALGLAFRATGVMASLVTWKAVLPQCAKSIYSRVATT